MKEERGEGGAMEIHILTRHRIHSTGHQTLPTTPYPTLMNITHHLCVIIILIVCGYHHLNNCTI